MSILGQIVMYLGVCLGVFISGAIRGNSDRVTIWIAGAVALVIIPSVFERLQAAPDAPFIVRFGLFVQNGVFWDVLFDGMGQLIRGA